MVLVTAAFTIILFQGVDDTLSGVQNRNGALFFITLTVALNSIQNIILMFPDEKPVFLREVNNNMYKVGPYFCARILCELPMAIIVPVVFGSLIYFAIGFSTVFLWKFFMFLFILINLYICAGSFALIVSVLVPDRQLAVAMTPVLVVPFMLFAGFFVSSDNIPAFLIEFQYMSFFKYGYQALMLNEYTDLSLECMYLSADDSEYCDPLGTFDSS